MGLGERGEHPEMTASQCVMIAMCVLCDVCVMWQRHTLTNDEHRQPTVPVLLAGLRVQIVVVQIGVVPVHRWW